MRVLALNAGSSSLKAAVRVDRSPAPGHEAAIERLDSEHPEMHVSGHDGSIGLATGIEAALEAIGGAFSTSSHHPDAIAHRIVHGGPARDRTVIIDADVRHDLTQAIPLALSHLPAALELIALAAQLWPGAVQVACFDTTFFTNLPETSRRLPVPEELTRLGIRRYGFHGLAVESVLSATHT